VLGNGGAIVITIEVNNSDALRKLGRLESEVTHMLRAPIQRSLAVLHADMATYPPVRPGQRYIRGRGPTNAAGEVLRLTSQQLGKRWTERITEGGGTITGELGNNATYGPYVQDSELQAWMHRDRWVTNEQAAEDNAGEIQGFFTDAIDEFIASAGGA